MAKSSNTAKKFDLMSWAWIGAAGVLLVAFLLLSALLLFSGSDLRNEALEKGKRVEFSPSGGPIQGKLISLAEATGEEPAPKPEPEPEPEPAAEIEGLSPDDTPMEPMPELADEPEATQAPDFEPADTPEPEPTAEPAAEPKEKPIEEPSPAQPAKPKPQDPAPTASSAPSGSLSKVQKQTPDGVVPIVAKDGTMAWQHYAFGLKDYASDKPRIAIVLYGLGLGAGTTESAMALPKEITLSFSPYSRKLREWVKRARRNSHEILLDLPMQTKRYPAMDPGPYGLLSALSPAENYDHLLKVLAKADEYIGLLTPLHETLSTDANVFAPIMDGLSKHGIMLVSSQTEPSMILSKIAQGARVPVVNADVILDERIPESHIQNQLAKLEEMAKKQGFALGVGRSFPITVELVGKWAKTLNEKGIMLVPLTALTVK